MKKRIFICQVILAVCICFISCENPIMRKWWEETEILNVETAPAVPIIISHPKSAVYPVGTPARAMTVIASISDGSPLSYQWYSNNTDRNAEGIIINGATDTSYTPPTDEEGVTYYYVVVTSTVFNNSEECEITANAVSHTAGIGVNDMPVNDPIDNPYDDPADDPADDPYDDPIDGPFYDPNANANNYVITVTSMSVQNKVYDGTTVATVIGVPVLNGIAKGDDVAIVFGAVEFADANAGSNKDVVLSGWSLIGADAGKYKLQMPDLTADIAKADPVVNWPSDLEGSDGCPLCYIMLPGNGTSLVSGTFTWTDPNTIAVYSYTKQPYNMTFTPDDTLNYNTLTEDVGTKIRLPPIFRMSSW